LPSLPDRSTTYSCVGFLIRMLYIVAFGWWLSPLIRRKDNRKLVADITANLYFLISDPQSNVSRIGILQSEFPTVKVSWNNLLFTFVRWHGETNMSVAPQHAPRESYQLGPLFAAMEGRHLSERDAAYDFADAGRLLPPRLQALNAAFSQQGFPAFKERL
jgi:hypothetical protein